LEEKSNTVKRLEVIVNHSKEHLQENLEEFINSPHRAIEKIEFRPVPTAAGGLVHTAYVVYEERKPEEEICEHCGSAAGNDAKKR
jgi:hypothetical protein